MPTSTNRTASFQQLEFDGHYSEIMVRCPNRINALKPLSMWRSRHDIVGHNWRENRVLARIVGGITNTPNTHRVGSHIVSARSVVSTPFMRFLSTQTRWFVLCAMLVCTNAASAQQVFPPGTFSIDGFPVNCGNTITIITPQLPDIAVAQPGRILLHPMLRNYPTGVKLFVYAHECAHQFVGANEPAADAWAIKLGRNQGWINLHIINQICQAVWFSPGDWTHFPGPQRCQMMISAYMIP